LRRLKDPEVLATAAREGRILVSHDCRTMPRHFANFIAAGTSPGVLLVPQHLPMSVAVEEIVLIWSAADAEEFINRICFLPL
jgi:hypothetical protein